MDIKQLKTLMGFTAAELAAELDRELPKDAYKAVPGAAQLTDIDPNYMRAEFNRLFGTCGVGWGYQYEAGDLIVEPLAKKNSRGETRNVYDAQLRRLVFWYILVDEQGKQTRHEVQASGGSENDNAAYAAKGAITSALGNAASNIGFQQSVYLGHRSHATVGKAPAPVKSVTTKAATSSPKGKPAPAPVPAAGEPVQVNDPGAFKVAIGKRAGQTLAEIFAGADGPKAIQFYTTMAAGEDPAKIALRDAAVAFLAKQDGRVPAGTAA